MTDGGATWCWFATALSTLAACAPRGGWRVAIASAALLAAAAGWVLAVQEM